MGTKMVQTYATLTLACLEENLYEIISKKYGNNIKEDYQIMENILGWLLHILEVPMRGDINELHDLLQNLHPKIKQNYHF